MIGLVVLLLFAQFLHPASNHGEMDGPKDITVAVAVPPEVLSVLKKSCYDCHSDYTTYLCYDNITPINYWVDHHISEGKRELNFSTFADYTAKRQAKKLDEIAEQVEKGDMPLGSYTLMHQETKLSEAQRKLIIDWAKAAEGRVKQP